MAEILVFFLWLSSVSSFLSSNSLGWLPVRSTTPRSKSAKTPSSQVDLHCWHTTLAAKCLKNNVGFRTPQECCTLRCTDISETWFIASMNCHCLGFENKEYVRRVHCIYLYITLTYVPRKVWKNFYQLKCARSHLSNKEHFSLDRNDQGWGPGRNRLANAFPPLRVGDA